jgi:hypothetical protein
LKNLEKAYFLYESLLQSINLEQPNLKTNFLLIKLDADENFVAQG